MSNESVGKVETPVLPENARVLIVDDELLICRQLASGLARAGFQAVTANNAERAVVRARETPPDVAIVDLEMPGIGGYELIRELKRLYASAIHVIVLTGQNDERFRANAFDTGADDYLVKPVSHAEIRRRVSAASRNLRAYVQVRLEKEATERRLVYGQEASALLAHDLNNGLSVSLSNLSFLLDAVQGDNDTMEALAATLRSVRRMAGLVANFVDIARFEDAAVKPTTGRFQVRAVLQSVIEVHAPSITKNVTFEIDCPLELEARFDSGLIERVLHNLFSNSIRYCTAGGRVVLIGKRWIEGEDGSVELSIANTGPLVPDSIRANLFGKYVRGNGGKRGMGLYFCRLVAEAHGGSLEYEPRADGPSFVLRLPGHS